MKLFILLALLFVMSPAKADLDSSMDELCTKIKTCATEKTDSQEFPPEMKKMITDMFDGMCKRWMQPYAQSVDDAGLEGKAEACVDSVVETNCETIMAAKGDFKTEECEEFEKAADEAGVDLKG